MIDQTIPLTEAQREAFEFVTNSSTIALVSVLLDGRPQACLAHIVEAPDGGWSVVPMALLLDDVLFERLTPPAGAEEARRG